MITSGNLTRIGIFYDGNFFFHVSNYYLYEHQRKSRVSINGLHQFIVSEIAREEERTAVPDRGRALLPGPCHCARGPSQGFAVQGTYL
jgi:hypothetical protein